MERIRIFIFLFCITIQTTCQRKIIEDYEAISDLLFELEKHSIFPQDIYLRYPPPPNLSEDSGAQMSESNEGIDFERFKKWKNRFDSQQEEIRNRSIDSTYTFLIADDSLFRSCIDCIIQPDSLFSINDYKRYQTVLDRLVAGDLEPIKLEISKIKVKGKYKLKSFDGFQDRKQLYENRLDFLCGGEIGLSRFYSDNNLGIFYITTTSCPVDCGAGYLVLMEYNEGKWKIFDLVLQYIA